MSTQENKALVRRYLEEIMIGNIELLDKCIAEDFTTPNPWKNREGLRKVLQDFHAAYRGLSINIGDMIAEEDRVAVHYQVTSTDGDGQKSITATHIYRIADGKIVEECGNSDSFY